MQTCVGAGGFCITCVSVYQCFGLFCNDGADGELRRHRRPRRLEPRPRAAGTLGTGVQRRGAAASCDVGKLGHNGKVTNGTKGGKGSGGTIAANYYIAKPGGDGTPGDNGGGGGGGGGGAGCDNGIDADGSGGGGGGAGGCMARAGGGGGKGGGGSFAIFFSVSSTLTVDHCLVQRGNGGNGGNGGDGGQGQPGGPGGNPGTVDKGAAGRLRRPPARTAAMPAAAGGGAGGDSTGILYFYPSTTAPTVTSTTFSAAAATAVRAAMAAPRRRWPQTATTAAATARTATRARSTTPLRLRQPHQLLIYFDQAHFKLYQVAFTPFCTSGSSTPTM